MNKKILIVFIIMFSSPFDLLADLPLYDYALSAIKAGDCHSAINALMQFRAQYASQLKQNPEFSYAVDQQIAICINTQGTVENSTIGAGINSGAVGITYDIDH
jgi:hypothetical protein